MDEVKEIKKYLYKGVEYNSIEDVNEFKLQEIEKFQKVYKGNYMAKFSEGHEHVFEIFDEGPIDYGSRSGPIKLATVSGTYENVVKYAIGLSGFWGYGPGKIKELKVIKI